jgi:hypothetical protein
VRRLWVQAMLYRSGGMLRLQVIDHIVRGTERAERMIVDVSCDAEPGPLADGLVALFEGALAQLLLRGERGQQKVGSDVADRVLHPSGHVHP